jgi:hypothetical protein
LLGLCFDTAIQTQAVLHFGHRIKIHATTNPTKLIREPSDKNIEPTSGDLFISLMPMTIRIPPSKMKQKQVASFHHCPEIFMIDDSYILQKTRR